MRDGTASNGASVGRNTLPKRDWVLLTLLSLLTVIVLSASVELVARRLLTTNHIEGIDCMVLDNPLTGPLGIPNCVCVEKILENKPTVYRFNSSGFRDNVNFAPKAPSVYRITMMGTSIAGGFRVPVEQTFGVTLPAELSRLTGRNVELYNEGLPWRSPQMIAQHFDRDVLATTPDLIIWILTPDDLRRTDWTPTDTKDSARTLNPHAKFSYYIKTAVYGHSVTAAASDIFEDTRTAKLMEKLLYRSPGLYVQSSLRRNADQITYLRSNPPADLQTNLRNFDLAAGEIEREAREAGIPVIAIYIPNRTQVSMASMGTWPAGFDPYKLSDELKPIVTSHGWTYIDILPDYKSIPNPQLGFFALDGHLNVQGHAIVTKLLAKHLTGGAVPSLAAASHEQSALAQPGPLVQQTY